MRLTAEYIHLWVENAGRRLNNADRLIVHSDSVESIFAIFQNSYKLQTNILRVHLGGEAVGHSLRLASGNLDLVARSGQVTQNLRLWTSILKNRAADNGNANSLRFIVGDV